MTETPSKPKPHLFVCTPAYGGQITVGCAEGLRKLAIMCLVRGVDLSLGSVTTESLIPRARNFFVACTLGRPEYTHLMFIDADITFDPESVFHMLAANKPIAGGCYPIKNLDWERIKAIIAKDAELPASELPPRIVNYAMNVQTLGLDKRKTSIEVTDGFLPVDEVATGFMMIRRDVLDAMKKKYPEKAYVNDMAGYASPQTNGNFYNFFDCIIHPESRRYLSEDYSFCILAKQLGFDVFADLTVDLTHTGVYNFVGSIRKCLQLTPTANATATASSSS
jgi:hypothetical protein